jgi:TRAP-type C4-dicarboxylate transport system permease small subunit
MAAVRSVLETYSRVTRALVLGLAVVSAVAVLAMMAVTCTDVLMRMFGSALRGSRDMVCVAAAVAAGCALPYTTAVKGHVAVEFFFHKLGGIGRVVVDTLMRLLGMVLFAVFAWCCFRHAKTMHMPRTLISGEHALSIWPIFLLTCLYTAALAAWAQRTSQKGWRVWDGKRLTVCIGAFLAIHAVLVVGWWRFLVHAREMGLFAPSVHVDRYMNLPIPHAPVMYMLSYCCGVVVLVILHNLLHPGREMIKP